VVTLVTGATGFLGSRVARLLCGRGERVRVLVRTSSDRRRIADLPVEVVIGDVTDRKSVEEAMSGAARVYHVAAHYELGPEDPALMERINVGGTRAVLEVAAARSIRAVHVSSVTALGPTGPAPEGEAHWRVHGPPRSVYEDTKRRAHEVARRIAAAGAPLRIALPVTIYGPDDPSVIGHFHRFFVRGFVPLAALPDMMISFVHVDDCAEGLERVLERGKDGEEYILSAQVLSFRQWHASLASACGRAAPRGYLPGWAVRRFAPLAARLAPLAGVSAGFVREAVAMSGTVHWAFSGDKASRELGFAPRSLDAGLRQVAAFYRPDAGC
jgi:dihydroflavonol-4-reductase